MKKGVLGELNKRRERWKVDFQQFAGRVNELAHWHNGIGFKTKGSRSSKIVVSGSESKDQIGKSYVGAGLDRGDVDFC